MGVQTPSTKREANGKEKLDSRNPSLFQDSQTKPSESSTDSIVTPFNNKPLNDANDLKRKSKCISNLPPALRSQPTLSTTTLSSSSSSSSQFHIHLLYAVTVCLTLFLLSAGIVCYVQITSLKQDLNDHKVIVSQLILDVRSPPQQQNDGAVFMPYHPSYHNDFRFQKYWDTGMKMQEEMLGQRTRNKREAPTAPSFGKKDKKKNKDDEWLWMSSYSRVSRSREGMMVALKSYCREAQLYCAANGKPGSAGPKGDRGESGSTGFTGQKGDKGERGEVNVTGVQNYAKPVQGPPGPKGDRGQRGPQGTPGRKGDAGKSGHPGVDGLDGTQGPRGAKGDSGKRGLLGFPGHKGVPGPIGPRGPKGERGLRGVEGLDGPKGDRGYKGSEGSRGTSGMPGVPGLKGLIGSAGPMGPPGRRGMTGIKGQAGHCEIQCVDTRKPTTALYTANSVERYRRNQATRVNVYTPSMVYLPWTALFLLIIVQY